MDCVACIDETTAGPGSPNGYYLYGGHVGRPLIYHRQESVFAHADVVGETSPKALPICAAS